MRPAQQGVQQARPRCGWSLPGSRARGLAHARALPQASIGTQISVWFSRLPFFTGAVLVACCSLSLASLFFGIRTFTAVCLEPYFVVFAGEGAQRPFALR